MVNWVTNRPTGAPQMKASSIVLALLFLTSLKADDALDKARQLEKAGDVPGARAALAAAVQHSPGDVDALAEYAEFLVRYGDPDSRAAYNKTFEAIEKSGDREKLAAVARELTILDLIDGDRSAAAQHLEAYHAAGGNDWPGSPGWKAAEAQNEAKQFVNIPGPLRSFGRMAAIASDINPDDILSALARNVVTNGYQASHSNEALEQTEYLKLVHRYLTQARELEKLAGEQRVIKVEACESPAAADLIRVLGFRMRGGCGSEVVLETVNAARAFLTTDSGFPVAELEQALRTNRPFTLDYHPTKLPVLYGAEYWQSAKDKTQGEFIDYFIGDPSRS